VEQAFARLPRRNRRAGKAKKQVPPLTMNQKELKELIDYVLEKGITEFELERGDVKLRIKRGGESVVSVSAAGLSHPPAAATPSAGEGAAAGPPSPAPPKAVPPPEEGLHMVRSPIVGTYYESPSPGSPPFVQPGDMVEAGQVLCIVEAMKLMNEIESDASGELVKILVSNGQPIEYGQELFAIRVKG
jgi:acetyl-CoA carboxylase biotin carboxyl carrier protein